MDKLLLLFVVTYIPSERFYLCLFWNSVVPLTCFHPMFHSCKVYKRNTGLKWVKEPLINRFKVLINIYFVWNIGVLILESRWICRLRFIAFLCSFIILYFVTSFKRFKMAHLTIKYSQSDVYDLFLIAWWNSSTWST